VTSLEGITEFCHVRRAIVGLDRKTEIAVHFVIRLPTKPLDGKPLVFALATTGEKRSMQNATRNVTSITFGAAPLAQAVR
jgi:hypothetical protein